MKANLQKISTEYTTVRLGISVFFVAAVMSISILACKSAAQKETAAKQNVAEANQDLENTKEKNAADWKVFKAEAEAKILSNDQRIAELKIKANKPGSTYDSVYKNRIEKLETQNNGLKSRIKNYNSSQTDWQTFKSDFNREMDEVGKNLKDIFN
ncbi:MAG: hypothetical protein RLZZ312_178 [Bacteroidota bacterium]|jgi:hypothetical protein